MTYMWPCGHATPAACLIKLALRAISQSPILLFHHAHPHQFNSHALPPSRALPAAAQVPPTCRFATLNEMTAGQEEIDDIITRDIHRTFPEHPLFGLEVRDTIARWPAYALASSAF